MKITRREFLKVSGASGAALGGLLMMSSETRGEEVRCRIRYAKQTTTICPYCGVGCGMIVSVSDGKVINIEGDPDHPINEGALCSKGGTLYQVVDNERRLKKVLYRAPRSAHWEEKSWDWAIEAISTLVIRSHGR